MELNPVRTDEIFAKLLKTYDIAKFSSINIPAINILYHTAWTIMEWGKEDERYVKDFCKGICFLTYWSSRRYKTYCLAFQKHGFCTAKAVVLVGKTAAFASSKYSCCFLTELSLQNQTKNSLCCIGQICLVNKDTELSVERQSRKYSYDK